MLRDIQGSVGVRIQVDVGKDAYLHVDFYVWRDLWRPIRVRLRGRVLPFVIEEINR